MQMSRSPKKLLTRNNLTFEMSNKNYNYKTNQDIHGPYSTLLFN